MVEKVYRIGLQRNFFALFSIPEMFIVMPFLETFSTFLKLFQPFYFWFRITHSLTKHVVAGKVLQKGRKSWLVSLFWWY